jgi:hypothetical protein
LTAAIVSVPVPSFNRIIRPLKWPDLAEDRLCLGRLVATALLNFLPLPVPAPTFLAEQESSASAVQPSQLGAPAVTFVVSIAIEAAMVRARKRKTETNNGDHRYLQEVRR